MIPKRLFFFALILVMSGCVSPYTRVKDINIPLQRPYYSMLPPKGEDWYYYKNNQEGLFELVFGKNIPSRSHTLIGVITEMHSYAKFDNPEEFLRFTKKNKELNIDPRRFKVISDDILIDDKFGDYCVHYYYVSEDHNAPNRGSSEFLSFKMYGYAFIHPHFNTVIIDIQYSERGLPEEIDPEFNAKAVTFIEGLLLKNNKSN